MRSLTIGFFDGVHKGHQEVLKHCSTVITFSNHPKEILGGNPPPLLTPEPFKTKLLQDLGLEVISIPFTKQLSQLTFEEFLAPYSFDRLILGMDSAFGKNRLGTPDNLRLLGLKRGFQVEVIPNLANISSSKIRALIQDGDLASAQKLLGRPHYLCNGLGLLPPPGIYQVQINGTSTLLKLPCSIPKGIVSFNHMENNICQATSLAAL